MRKGSIGSERGGCRLERGAYQGKGLGVLTSGGDSQGMNAAVRACVRTALFLGCRVFLVHEGYQGMVDGGSNIVSAEWVSVSSIIHLGGTVIGSARCEDFRHRSGRLKAANNLVTHGITNLIIIGGDGSLTAAHIFREEWSGLLDELLKEAKITSEMKRNNHVLHVVGIVGSIDNDFCGTDMTIGTDSALHRILEAVDSIVSTASSHQRTFIMEVMGRHCGYLSLITGIVAQADFVFCPESPPPPDWPQQISDKLTQERDAGQRLNIIIVAEGAVDVNGEPITAEQVKKVLTETAHRDTRVVVLGHVQRGGLPSAYDRILGCRMGAAAAMALMEATHSDDTEPVVISIHGNQIVRASLMECVKQTKAVGEAMAAKNWELAAKLRGPNFMNNINLVKESYRLKPKTDELCKCQGDPCNRFGVMNIGVPAGGMNAAVVAFVRGCIMQGDTAIGIADGIEGLIKGNCKELSLKDVVGHVSQAGSFLGIKRSLPDGNFREIAHNLRKFNIQGLLLVGGFDAFVSCLAMSRQRLNFPEFCIPMIVIPATISNNVPGTDFTLGCDTSLNEITEICDRIRSSAQGTKHRVFIIETMGGRCGYLATLAAIAGGADAAYIFEEKFTIKDLSQDIAHMSSKMNEGVQRGLILCNEKASANYTTDFIHKLYAEEGKGTFSCRMNILGHLQQGGSPTPFDRKLGLKMGKKSVDFLTAQIRQNKSNDGSLQCTTDESVVLIGLVGHKFQITKLEELVPHTDFVNRIPKKQWWLRLRPLLKIMAKHASAYEDSNFKPPGPVDINCSVN